MRRNSSRYSVGNVLRLVRGALNANARAGIRYRRRAAVELRLSLLVAPALRAVEKQLRFALRDVLRENGHA